MSENNGSTGNKKFLKGTLILTASSMVHRLAELDYPFAHPRRRGHRAVSDGLSDLPDGDNGFVGGHTGGYFHHYGGKSGGERFLRREKGVQRIAAAAVFKRPGVQLGAVVRCGLAD